MCVGTEINSSNKVIDEIINEEIVPAEYPDA
jgi:hypothetical protein